MDQELPIFIFLNSLFACCKEKKLLLEHFTVVEEDLPELLDCLVTRSVAVIDHHLPQLGQVHVGGATHQDLHLT